MVKIMHDQGMLQKLNLDLIPNRANVDPDYMKLAFDPAMDHSVPYTVTITCLGYLGSKVPDFKPTWGMLDRADLKGRMTMLNDHREVIGVALKYLGYSLNTTNDDELAAAKDVVLRWKKNLAKFENEQYKTGLASGEFLLTHGYSGDLMLVQSENDDIRIAVPEEGSALSFDDMVVPADARQVDLAHAFIDFSTLWHQERYVVFAVLDVSLDIGDDRFVEYFAHPTFKSDEEFERYIRRVELASLYAIPMDVKPTDALLTLSTCLDEDRLVILARRQREGEKTASLREIVNMAVRQ